MTLDQLIENDFGIIHQINDEGLEEQMLRMGFLIGEEIKVDRIAPLKDPILISSGTCYISIRKDDARKIVVNQAH